MANNNIKKTSDNDNSSMQIQPEVWMALGAVAAAGLTYAVEKVMEFKYKLKIKKGDFSVTLEPSDANDLAKDEDEVVEEVAEEEIKKAS